MTDQVLAELRSLRESVDELTAIVAGPKSGRHMVSGAKAARLLGMSWPTFKTRYVQPGLIRPQCGNKFELKQIRNLKKENPL